MNRLEMGKEYPTDQDKTVGPFDETTWIASEPESGEAILTFDWKVNGEWACWWDTGVPANPLAETYGEIVLGGAGKAGE